MSKEGLNPTPTPSEATKTYEGYSEEGEYYGEYDWELGEFEEQEDESEGPEKEVEEENIYYNQKDFISKPYLSEDSKVPEDVLDFDYSYGYDCRKLFNLCVVDTVVLIFASGNIIHFFDTSTGKKWYRRCFSGGGIGHITTNPIEPHIAVGEKGENPLIIIYEWPSFEIVTILKRGTKTAYTFLNYSPDGELLCSQGGQPDYMLTIWNWRKHRIMLRSKAYGQTVFNSRFSLYVPGHLTTSGISHIKFWKINQTFTGLKLLGDLGRFGKSEICNIIGFLALPDEKVVSGCEWGNILVWDAGLIRVEVFRRRKNFCHEAPITQFIYNNGELMSVAMDGTIKVWYYETIEMADPPEEDRFIEVEPIFEFEIGDYYHKAKLLLIVKASPDDSDDHTWYGQDANGGIWKLDLNMSVTARPASVVFSCHSGKVAAIQCSPFSPHFASLGEDGRIFVYDYNQKTMIMKKEFLAGGCSLLWLPLAAEESGCVLIGGFEDGVIRVMCVSIFEYSRKVRSPTDDYINLIQVLKPHTKAVTSITINPKQTIIATGSEDSTIFVFQIKEGRKFVELVPIGYVPVAGEVMFCTWKPKKESTLLVSCKNGVFMEMVLPTEPVITESLSLLLNDVPIRKQTFVSIKSEVRRNLKQAEIQAQRQILIDAKREELMKKSEETGVPIDETIMEAYQEELEAEEPELPDIYIPKIPSPILFAAYMGNSICLSMGGYDAGYIYEYDFDKEGPVRYKMVADGDDIEIHVYQLYYNDKFLILGMRNGNVRVVYVNNSDRVDMSNYWSLAMHDNDNGVVRDICFNYNYSYMFTCGEDGNVFSYRFNPGNYEFKNVNIENVVSKGFPTYICPDLDDRNAPSLEQARNKLENEERIREANQYKRELIEVLKGMEKKVDALLKRNSRLPKSQQLSPSDLVLDERIEDDLNRTLQEDMKTIKFQLAWQSEKTKLHFQKLANYFVKGVNTHAFRVHGINNKELYAEAFRLRALGDDFPKAKKLLAIKFEEQEAKGRAQARLYCEEEFVDTVTRRLNPVEGLLKQIMALVGDYKKNIKLRRLLRKYRERKDKLESRRIEWYEMAKRKPNPDKPYVEDVTAIENAKDTIGDYQLKTAPDYKVSKNAKVTTVHVFEQLLKVRETIYSIKKNYNDMVAEMRQKKLDIIERHQYLRELLLEIAKEIPKEKVRHPPSLPTYVEDVEFPEKKLTPNAAGIYEELPKRFKNMYAVETVKKQEIKLLDKEYEMLLLEKRGQKLGKVHSRLSLMKFTGITGSRDIEELEEAGKDDQVMTPWEKECKKLRVIKRLYEQDGIIDEMDSDIREFDEKIFQLNELKYESNVKIKFLELFVLTLHQEILILKKFEAAENQKEAKLFEKLHEKHEIQKKMNELNAKVDGRNREIRKCEEEIKNLVTMFHAATAENKFYDFLRRIFKKKYRPPKVKSDDSDSESESESSSSSEEEEAKSLDSKEIGPIRLDETVCPPGCDQHLYEWTFTQRSERHNLELNIQEEKKQIEFHKKELETLTKKVKLVDSEYVACEEDLEEFMREKQRNLNEVETVVILKLNQIQNFRSESEIENISESILFSSSRLTNLYKRVGELEKETQMERQKHEKNRQHLTRMKIDIAHMKNMIIQLAKDIDAAMIRKFGMKVDIDDIEESLLKRLVGEMRHIVFDLKKELDKKLNVIRKEVLEKEKEYLKKVQDNTERYNLLTVLQEEKMRLKDILQKQEKKSAATSVREANDERDFEKLQKVIETQDGKIKELRKEIGTLKMKAKSKPPPAEKPETIERIRLKGCDGEWIEIDETTKEELKDMFGEAHEIVQDAKEGEMTEDDISRMRKLTSDIFQKLPVKCRDGLIRRLSHVTRQEQISKRCAEEILEEIIRTLRTESFLEAMDVVKGIIESIIPHVDSK